MGPKKLDCYRNWPIAMGSDNSINILRGCKVARDHVFVINISTVRPKIE